MLLKETKEGPFISDSDELTADYSIPLCPKSAAIHLTYP